MRPFAFISPGLTLNCAGMTVRAVISDFERVIGFGRGFCLGWPHPAVAFVAGFHWSGIAFCSRSNSAHAQHRLSPVSTYSTGAGFSQPYTSQLGSSLIARRTPFNNLPNLLLCVLAVLGHVFCERGIADIHVCHACPTTPHYTIILTSGVKVKTINEWDRIQHKRIF